MAALELPYPVSVGRIQGGIWSSSVPDRLEFEGRVGVPVGDEPARVRERLEAVVGAACPEATITWSGGRFDPGETSADHPFSRLVLEAARDELGREVEPVGVPYGAALRDVRNARARASARGRRVRRGRRPRQSRARVDTRARAFLTAWIRRPP
jgi:acetylornithine deacetylase